MAWHCDPSRLEGRWKTYFGSHSGSLGGTSRDKGLQFGAHIFADLVLDGGIVLQPV
jgi:hypothetical protein